jgi:hypothetical protein
VSLTQLPPAWKTNTICVNPTSEPSPMSSSIPPSNVAAVNLFHLDVQCFRRWSFQSRRPVSLLPISSILKSIPCHLFDCWVIVSVDVITQYRCHQEDNGSSQSLAGSPSQMPSKANNTFIESAHDNEGSSGEDKKGTETINWHLQPVDDQ